jgi:xylulokinase
MAALLGIDIGTSSVKALLFDTAQARPVAAHGVEYPIHTPTPGWAEQDPDDYWRATIAAVRQVTAQAGRNDVAAISFSGQMHGTILLDADNRPLHRAIIWADTRSGTEVGRLVANFPAYASIAGTLPATGFLIGTLSWLAAHQPDLLHRAARVILPKDYVRLMMTGSAATEVSDAAGSGAFAVARGEWATEIIASAGLPFDLFPPVLQSTSVAGTLLPAAAEALGLPAGIPVIAGCGDQPAQAVGNGLIAPGAASVTVGTGGQVCVPLQPQGALRTDERLHVFNHAVPGMCYVLGATLSAGLSLRWLRNLVGLQDMPNAYESLSAEAATVAPGADGLLFLPYLAGERTPHMDPRARGTFVGLSLHHTRAHLARAVMEGVCFALRQALEISLALSGPVNVVIVSGGGMESALWRQMMADVTGLPLQKSLMAEQACTGAALLAGVGAGVYNSLEAACHETVRRGTLTEPDAARHAFYDQQYAQFLALYPLLREQMHTLVNRAAHPG